MSFNTMFKVFDKGEPKREDIEKIPSFMFCKWLSNNPNTIHSANNLNLYYDIPIFNQFLYINKQYKGKKFFIKFPKNDVQESYDMELISRHFNVSKEKAKMYIDFISDEELNTIRDLYIDSKKG